MSDHKTPGIIRPGEEPPVDERREVAMALAGAVAHELNQPLTSILGYVEMLRRKLGPDHPQDELLATIQTEAERAAAIVKRLATLQSFEEIPYVGTARIFDLGKNRGGGGEGER